NPVSVEGQIIGSVWMGMGQALTEEMVWKDGLLMNPGLLEYRSPSSVESPEVEPIIVESIDPEGPFGAKECSEGSLAATIPAIANAIYDAVGIRLHEAPFTPERVLAALRTQRSEKSLNLTEGVDPMAPMRFREHGGALCFKGKGPERHTYCGGRHRSYSFSAAEALRAAARTRYPSHPRTQRDPANRRGHRDRCTHYAHPNRAFRFSAATLLSAGGSRKNRRFAHPPQYGHNWRQYLFGHALSLVQPVAHLA